MPVLVNGVSAEYNDFQDDIAFDVAILADDAAGTGSYSTTQLFRQGLFDWDDSEGNWAQTHEAVWSADQAITRMQEVAAANDDFDYSTSPDAARAWMLKGFANVRLGENFCHVVYTVASSSPRPAAFDSAIASFNEAIVRAGAAGAAADEYAVAASSPENCRFQRRMYSMGTVMPMGMARVLMPSSMPCTWRCWCAGTTMLEPATMVSPRPM